MLLLTENSFIPCTITLTLGHFISAEPASSSPVPTPWSPGLIPYIVILALDWGRLPSKGAHDATAPQSSYICCHQRTALCLFWAAWGAAAGAGYMAEGLLTPSRATAASAAVLVPVLSRLANGACVCVARGMDEITITRLCASSAQAAWAQLWVPLAWRRAC